MVIIPKLLMTPFEALYGYSSPQLSVGPLLETVVPAAEDVVMQRQQMLQLLKDNLHKAQERMKVYAIKSNQIECCCWVTWFTLNVNHTIRPLLLYGRI